MTTSALRKQFQAPVGVLDAPADRARRFLQQLLTGFGPRTADGLLVGAGTGLLSLRAEPSRLHHEIAYRHDDGGSGDDGGWD